MATIPTLPEKLLQLIRNGENYQIEYKEAWNQLPKSLFDTVCSFSNREGGDIFLGVHDTGVTQETAAIHGKTWRMKKCCGHQV